jgi:ribose-phosphate pyrophosphokinase
MSYEPAEAKIFTCSQSRALAEEIATKFGAKLGNVITSTYSDGEFQPSYEESIRGATYFYHWLYTSRT